MATTVDNDYLECSEYQSQITGKDLAAGDFVTFQHRNGDHYFSWTNGKETVLRSEAYPSEEKMQRGVNAINKNKDLVERYSVEQVAGEYFLILWGGGDHQKHTGNMESHNEIGRSCGKKSKAALNALLASVQGQVFADQVIPLPVEAPLVSVPVMTAEPVQVSTTAAIRPAAPYAMAKPAAPEPFAWWRVGIPLATAALATFYFLMPRSENVAPKLTPVAQAPQVSIPPAPVAAVKTAPVEVAKIAPAMEKVVAPVVEKSAPAVNTARASLQPCSLNWLFFDFDRAEVSTDAKNELGRAAEILKGNSSYVAVLSAHTDSKGNARYNRSLSARRAEAAKKTLVAFGVNPSQINTAAKSAAAPVAVNTTDDTGRQYNRRVELAVRDTAGREICKSEAPAIPASVKNN